jgi:hypothetical protein
MRFSDRGGASEYERGSFSIQNHYAVTYAPDRTRQHNRLHRVVRVDHSVQFSTPFCIVSYVEGNIN